MTIKTNTNTDTGTNTQPERGGIKLAVLAWVLGVPGLIAAALLLL